MQNNTYEAIRLDAVHGYRLDGDSVELNAQLMLGEGVSLASWRLQLWAKDALMSGASGIKVAEVNLGVAQVNDSQAHLQTRLDATLPPTGRYYDMALVLTGAETDTPVEVVNYRERQWIAGPFLQGAVGYAVNGEQVTVSVEQVCNPRGDGNVSGTLALELWATREPYLGGAVDGHQLAGVTLGTLVGQTSRHDVAAQLDFVAPPEGQWQVALLLREWTATGYVTRDFRAFDAAYTVLPSPADAASAPRAVAATAVEATVVEARATVATAIHPTAVKSTPTAPTPVSAPAPAKAVDVALAAEVTEHAGDARVSANTASLEELAQVKGLSRKVAQEIVRARPFKSLAELTRVKGIGDKTLRAVRHAIKL